MKRIHYLAILATGLLVGALGGWFRPASSGAALADAGTAQWSLPTEASLERSSAAQVTEARMVRWVGDAAGGGDGGTLSQSWTLRGLLRPEGVALVQSGSDPQITRVEIDGILPDGSRLVAVERDSVSVERDGCRTRHPLYLDPTAEKSSDGADCAAGALDKETPQP